MKENELTFLSLAQIDELLKQLAASRNPHATMVSRLALSTGARWSEANDLLKTQIQGNRIQFARTKSGKARALPISAELRAELDQHMTANPTGNERVFEPCYSAFITALERTSIVLPDGQASHVLRHSFASHFMMRGGNILALQRALGHSSLAMTMRYAHLSPDHMEEVVRLNPLAPKTRQGWSDAAANLVEKDSESSQDQQSP
ncbi:MAG: tyrosine-type recombinase/integrase [Burkholderiales bacterium]|nr:tyrosine-type recombinase/integrase [Burkholderiales bacterium]